MSLTKQVEKLQEELKDERQLSSSLIKQKERTTDARDKDINDHKEVGVQFDYLIPQSGMCVCVCTGSRYDVSVLFQI